MPRRRKIIMALTLDDPNDDFLRANDSHKARSRDIDGIKLPTSGSSYDGLFLHSSLAIINHVN